MTTHLSSFRLSNETYNDNIYCSPLHFNALRAKPIYPPAIVENNLNGLRIFPNKSLLNEDKNSIKHFMRPKRCLFRIKGLDEKIHLRSLDFLSNQYLLEKNIQFPDEDDIYKVIGQKMKVQSKRNNIEERSSGDKSYKVVEYSIGFFSRLERNWKSEILKFTYRPNQQLNISSTSERVQRDEYEDLTELEKEKIHKKEVKDLDNWMPARPLKFAFQVLDLDEKAPKYRPRVIR
jgi:hypothetical protein